MMNTFIDDLELIGDGKHYQYICGVDEAGRGPLCGPVAAAAVIMPRGSFIEGVNDSKKLTEKKREALYELIIKESISYHVCLIDNDEIDRINILNATLKAMEQAINGLSTKAEFALIDGNRNKGITTPNQTVVKGDAKSYSIACASILAKVFRDRLMMEYDKEFADYGFAKHKGYGTAEHIKVLKQKGPCKIHRKTFIKNFMG